MSVMISEIPVDMIINTGDSIDILDETAYHCFITKLTIVKKSLSTHTQCDCLHMDLNHSYMLLVVLKLRTITVRNNHTASTLHVLESSHGSLLSTRQQ